MWSTGVTNPLTEADLTEAEIAPLDNARRLMVEALDNNQA
jgi:hypothetical protein